MRQPPGQTRCLVGLSREVKDLSRSEAEVVSDFLLHSPGRRAPLRSYYPRNGLLRRLRFSETLMLEGRVLQQYSERWKKAD